MLQISSPRRGGRARSSRDQRRRWWSCRAAQGLQTAEQGDMVEKQDPSSAAEELTTEQKRENVIRLAFGGNQEEFNRFIEIVHDAIPPGTGVILRGSAV